MNLNTTTIKGYLKLQISLFNFFFNISWSNRASRVFDYRATDRRFDIVNCQHVIRIEFVSIDTHVSARGRIYLLQSQQRATRNTSPYWRTHAHTYAGANTKGSIVWVIAGIAWNAKYYLIERVTELENDQGKRRRKRIERKIVSENYRDCYANVRWWIIWNRNLFLYEFLYKSIMGNIYKLYLYIIENYYILINALMVNMSILNSAYKKCRWKMLIKMILEIHKTNTFSAINLIKQNCLFIFRN